ncbi:Rpn family recombination-promoting nuclease/putative transposase [Anabaena azotica]|uniref:Rpn family recombination-promoting nuclease/putative transposase n=1 Tax=Anabaena azotica TaxID=197653 RepID=UPI0039A75FA4
MIYHRYHQLWEEDPAPLLTNPGLLPLATLAKTDSPNTLLKQVADQLDMIEENQERVNISTCVQLLAGLRFEKDVIRQLFREEIMQESVIYQDILQKGKLEGKQEGKQEGEVLLILRLLSRRFGAVDAETEERINQLSTTQLESLAEAILDFSNQADVIRWLENL